MERLCTVGVRKMWRMAAALFWNRKSEIRIQHFSYYFKIGAVADLIFGRLLYVLIWCRRRWNSEHCCRCCDSGVWWFHAKQNLRHCSSCHLRLSEQFSYVRLFSLVLVVTYDFGVSGTDGRYCLLSNSYFRITVRPHCDTTISCAIVY